MQPLTRVTLDNVGLLSDDGGGDRQDRPSLANGRAASNGEGKDDRELCFADGT